MKTPMPIKAGFTGIFLFTLFVASPAAAEPGVSEFARVSDLNGTLQVKGGYDADWVGMEVNAPVGGGDSLWLDPGGLAELEFPGGSRVRMQGETKLDLYEFSVLPASFVTTLEAVEGHIYIRTPRQSVSGETNPVDIRVPSARISIRPESLVRLDIESGRTRVRVQEGSARIDPFGPGEPKPISLGRMEQIRLELNAEPGFPGYFSAISEDGLERYNRYREDRFYKDGPDERLAKPLVGQEELERHGKWVLIGGINFWRPYVSISWRPYSVGRWAWYDGAGWMWISGEPFGYVTFHYGRWHFDPYYGWVWSPGYVFAPAYVHWIAVGPYYAWAPLGPYGYPVTTGYIHFSLNGGFGIDLNVWSYAHVDYFVGIRHHHHHPKRHVHFKNPDRRLFTEHQGRVIKAGTIAGQSRPSEKKRQFTRSDGNSWRPYPDLPRQERIEDRQIRKPEDRLEKEMKKGFLNETSKPRSFQRPDSPRKRTLPENFSKQERTDRSLEAFKQVPTRKGDGIISRAPRPDRGQNEGFPPELRKTPSVKREPAVPPRGGGKGQVEKKQYRQAPNQKGEVYQKSTNWGKAPEGFGDRGMKRGGSFKLGKNGGK